MATAKNTLKNWFKTLAKPTQAQFWAWMDSYWHKDEKIPTGSIDQLDTILGQKADEASVATRLASKADTSAIPQKNSQLENDSGYLTQHQDISWKADTDAANLTPENVISWKAALGVGESANEGLSWAIDEWNNDNQNPGGGVA